MFPYEGTTFVQVGFYCSSNECSCARIFDINFMLKSHNPEDNHMYAFIPLLELLCDEEKIEARNVVQLSF